VIICCVSSYVCHYHQHSAVISRGLKYTKWLTACWQSLKMISMPILILGELKARKEKKMKRENEEGKVRGGGFVLKQIDVCDTKIIYLLYC